jgi:uridylate kinase
LTRAVQPTLVLKYGGSSLADGAALMAVARSILRRQATGVRLVVVVSAMGDQTDGLLAQAHALVQSPPQRELDMLVTAGERICMALLCMCVAALGGRAKSFTGSQSGIVTEDAHQGARIVAIRPQRIHDALDGGHIVIVAGYQGVSTQGEITTLGRGGSDTTAVALGAALDAEAVEIYSDVDGVYTADPRICPQARHLSDISYDLMGSMASFGAQVLHDQAVAFARRANITLVAKKTNDPSGPAGRSTRMGPAVVVPADTLALATLPSCLLVGLEAAQNSLGAPGPHIHGLMARLQANNLRPVVSGGGAVLCVPHVAIGQVLAATPGAGLPAPWAARPVSAVTVVGHSDLWPLWPRAHALLAAADIAVVQVWGAPQSLTFAVAEGLGSRATMALHGLIEA